MQQQASQRAVLGRLAAGEPVIDRVNSHVKSRALGRKLLADSLNRVNPRGNAFHLEQVNFGTVVGNSNCVPTSPGDRIIFAQRPGRRGYTRFVKGRRPEPCNSVVVIIKAIIEGGQRLYVLVTAFVGKAAQPEPWDTKAILNQDNPSIAYWEALEFWENHALIWDPAEVVAGSTISRCPW